MLTEGEADYQATSAGEALAAAYARGENDEFVLPTLIAAPGQEPALVRDGDAVLFLNFRADRARQLSRVFTDPGFSDFERRRPALAGFVTTTEYAADMDAACAFPPDSLDNVLGDWLAQHGKTQLRLAETEKYAHVTFFFSGGREETFPGEKRIMVPSPDVATYDLKPEMSAAEVTDELVAAITSGEYDLIVCNYANGDMVGHTGVLTAAVKAVETLDHCLGRVEAALLEVGGQALVTADHGNCEYMRNPDGSPNTAHTTNLVHLVYVAEDAASYQVKDGVLADVAPTLLEMLGLAKPEEMTGASLLAKK
jgi:2,3-bisphosphoglycerate-independent phosphoglycerate mutase